MTSSIVKRIANRLKTARKAAGFKTAIEFSLTHKIPQSTYSQHETGNRSISAELIIAYSKQLKVNPHWMLTGQGSPSLEKIDKKKQNLYEENFIYQSTQNNLLNNLDLLKRILLNAETILKNNNTNLNYEEFIDYCFDIYDIVANLSATPLEKEKIINLSLASLKRDTNSDAKKQKYI